MPPDRLEREDRVDAFDDLGRRHDVVEPPAVRRADVHVLDEADVCAVPRKCRAMSTTPASLTPRLTTPFIFTGRPRRPRPRSLEDARDGEVGVVHRAERRVVERVEAHGDAVEPGVAECLRLAREERRVRRQRQVEPVDRREALDEALDLPAQERLAPGEPDLLDAEPTNRRATRSISSKDRSSFRSMKW